MQTSVGINTKGQRNSNQPRYEIYEPSRFFNDRAASRPIPDHTVPRGFLREDNVLYTGRISKGSRAVATQGPPLFTSRTTRAGAAVNNTGSADAAQFDAHLATAIPFAVTPESLDRGQEQFQTFCSVCHGLTGEGDGMVVRRGYKRPPSYHEDRLRRAPVGHFFDVITNGWGAMPAYNYLVMITDFAPPPEWGRWQMPALVAGVAAIALAAVGAFLTANARGFFFSYLVAYVFWTGVAVGCLAWVMLQFLARGAWGVAIRRVVESGAGTLPLMALLFVPIAAGMGELFFWSHGDAVARDEVLQLKQAYLNKPFFIARAVGYFAVWLVLAYLINRWSGEQDRTGDHWLTDYLRNLSGPGIIIFALTVMLAATDWVMSLDPHWSSPT